MREKHYYITEELIAVMNELRLKTIRLFVVIISVKTYDLANRPATSWRDGSVSRLLHSYRKYPGSESLIFRR